MAWHMAGVLSIVSIEKTFQHPCFPDDGFARMSDSNADLVNQWSNYIAEVQSRQLEDVATARLCNIQAATDDQSEWHWVSLEPGCGIYRQAERILNVPSVDTLQSRGSMDLSGPDRDMFSNPALPWTFPEPHAI
ncbi:hypothetical protein B0I73DRAFT_172087 [Yarrowia lipolytica]|nr:hypothetical protein BKA91DRAFT_168039 [Yarrowia lipolytica]KAE8169921.1 hypothetical protein BKA90DRAFT_170596 [Yarrowia lipolytica]RDW36220.1 hypothetical protein B0I73DRAFT_172087 [Yarrowia lipolytica]RDW42915.1 hypothetical protein B0I74DRAFT_176675 [Yarrowia lipolytica]RDW49653.1 hypothetical protein B0I75DRAFT_161072 [Yarrowia lipolytica]